MLCERPPKRSGFLAQHAHDCSEVNVLQIEAHRLVAQVHVKRDLDAESLGHFLIGSLRLSAKLKRLRPGPVLEFYFGR